jgi:hypothetical protein
VRFKGQFPIALAVENRRSLAKNKTAQEFSGAVEIV